MLADYCCANTMKDFVGSSFTVKAGELQSSLELVDVSSVKDSGKYESFSLFFDSDKTQLLPQSTYNFYHETMDETALFIVPIGETPEKYQYQVCFSYEKT